MSEKGKALLKHDELLKHHGGGTTDLLMILPGKFNLAQRKGRACILVQTSSVPSRFVTSETQRDESAFAGRWGRRTFANSSLHLASSSSSSLREGGGGWEVAQAITGHAASRQALATLLTGFSGSFSATARRLAPPSGMCGSGLMQLVLRLATERLDGHRKKHCLAKVFVDLATVATKRCSPGQSRSSRSC